ncbi:MAG: glycosyltransferase [Calditrichaeota bacterium]|nr:MAG: glycosyltransferase [Calditrichota bacterium]
MRLGLKVIRQENIQAIFSSAPPYTTHLIARNLKRATGLPWVADFRDSWIGWLSTPQWRPAPSRAVERRMERSVLAEADRILTVSEGVKEDLLSRHPHLRDARWSLLPNGFDPEDFPPKTKNECVRDRLILTYSGSLYGPRNPEYLIRALEAMQQNGTPALEHLRLRLVGRVGQPILDRIDSSPVRELFEFKPYMSHQASLALLQESDVLLLIIDDVPASRGILTGKLFEYIGAGKPILALAPDGEAADLIRAHGLGRVVHPKNVSEIRDALAELIELKSNGKLQVKLDRAVKEKFDRKTLTRRLAEILDGLVR